MASRRELRDVAALLALPAMWADQDPAYIAAGLLNVLFSMLRLEGGYTRFDDPTGGPALECWQPAGPKVPVELEPLLTDPARERGSMTVTLAASSGDGTVRVMSMFPAFPGENSLVLVSSRRTDFPTDLELYLLRAAVGQAAIAIHAARQLASERDARLAAEEALRRRNTFLATLAQDLDMPLTTLAEHAALAKAFVAEAGQPPALASVAADTSLNTDGAPGRGASVSPAHVSRREAEVLGLLAQGLSNKEIAGVLRLSERTVERHITSLYRKIGVERRSEATSYALRHGLVDTHPHDA